MDREQILRSEHYWIGFLNIQLYNILLNYKKENSKTDKQMMELLNLSKKQYKNICRCEFDGKMSEFCRILCCLNVVPNLGYKNLDEYIEHERDEIRENMRLINIIS